MPCLVRRGKPPAPGRPPAALLPLLLALLLQLLSATGAAAAATATAGPPLSQAASDLARRALGNHPHSLPVPHMRRGIIYQGANFRLRRVVNDLLSGTRTVKVLIRGGPG